MILQADNFNWSSQLTDLTSKHRSFLRSVFIVPISKQKRQQLIKPQKWVQCCCTLNMANLTVGVDPPRHARCRHQTDVPGMNLLIAGEQQRGKAGLRECFQAIFALLWH